MLIIFVLFVDVQLISTKTTLPLLTNDIQLPETLSTTNEQPWTIQVIYQDEQNQVTGLFAVDETLIPIQNFEKTLEIDTTQPILQLQPQQIDEEIIKEEPKQQHKQQNTNGKFVCPNCDRVYNARRNLSRHVNLECGKEPQYKCDHCSYKNHRRNEIKKHLMKKHQIYYHIE